MTNADQNPYAAPSTPSSVAQQQPYAKQTPKALWRLFRVGGILVIIGAISYVAGIVTELLVEPIADGVQFPNNSEVDFPSWMIIAILAGFGCGLLGVLICIATGVLLLFRTLIQQIRQ